MPEEQKPGQSTSSALSNSGDWLRDTLDDLSKSLRPGGFAEPGDPTGQVTMVGPDSCPDPGAWLHLALKDLPADESEKLLAHAAMCANCLQRLRQSRQMLSAEASAEDSVDPRDFESSSPNWQRKFAARLADTPRKSAVPKIPRRALWVVAVLAGVVLLAGIVSDWYAKHNNPESLLARAYTQSRTMELRIAGADFAPVASSSLASGGAAGNSSSLRDAQSILASQLKEKPDDPRLLHLEARADLLAGRYDAAINILDPLLAQGPVTAGLLTDDASAYFERGLMTGSQNDRVTALENLRRAEALAPADSVVLFNEAIVLEESGHINSAMDAWNRYLKVEKDPEWLADGRRRLQKLQQLQGSGTPQTRLNLKLNPRLDAPVPARPSAHRTAAAA